MKFKKRPATVDAWQVGSEDDHPEWISEALKNGSLYFQGGEVTAQYFSFENKYGKHYARHTDYIIREQDGSITRCSAVIFERLYEPAEG